MPPHTNTKKKGTPVPSIHDNKFVKENQRLSEGFRNAITTLLSPFAQSEDHEELKAWLEYATECMDRFHEARSFIDQIDDERFPILPNINSQHYTAHGYLNQLAIALEEIGDDNGVKNTRLDYLAQINMEADTEVRAHLLHILESPVSGPSLEDRKNALSKFWVEFNHLVTFNRASFEKIDERTMMHLEDAKSPWEMENRVDQLTVQTKDFVHRYLMGSGGGGGFFTCLLFDLGDVQPNFGSTEVTEIINTFKVEEEEDGE